MEIHEDIEVIQILESDGFVGNCPFRYEHCTNDCEYEEGMEYAYEYLCGYPGIRYANDCGFFKCPLRKKAVLVRFVEKKPKN